MKTLGYDSSEFNLIFVRKEMDSYGLTSNQFRLYGHLARRAGDDGAWPSVESMARYCRQSPNTIRSGLRYLKAQNLIRAKERPGFTTVYTLTSHSQWRPSPFQIHPYQRRGAPTGCKGTPTKRREGTPTKRGETKVSQEGYPLKDNTVGGRLSPPRPPNGEKEPPSSPTLIPGGRKPDGIPAVSRQRAKEKKRHPSNPQVQRQTPIRRKAYAVARKLRSSHWDNCKVFFVKEAARAFAEKALQNGHDERAMRNAYQYTLRYCHGVTTDEMNRHARHSFEYATPALTIWLARKRLEGDPRTVEERWQSVIARLTDEKRKAIEEDALIRAEIGEKAPEINAWFAQANGKRVPSSSASQDPLAIQSELHVETA